MKPSHNRLLTFGINGSLRKTEVQFPVSNQNTEYYLFNSAANMKAYSNNGLDFAYYGYNASNTRTYKLSMLNMGQWVNGHPHPIHPQIQQAMFYPNAYLNFNQNGEYTKHYYNGTERIASRLGNATMNIAATANARLNTRSTQLEDCFRNDIRTLVYAGDIPMDMPPEPVSATSLQQTGTPDDIFYYHTNHLGSTAFVTDQNQNITQGFLYAPFGEITTEYAPSWQNGTLPKYSFNAKELDEETGMYYYEARYYKPPVFTSRDAMFEKYFWMTPYAYCANNPVKYVDPSGEELETTILMLQDKKNNTNYSQKLMESLSLLTGLNISISNSIDGRNILTYEKNANGEPVIRCDHNGEKIGSEEAREMLVNAIDLIENVSIRGIQFENEKGSKGDDNCIILDFSQINGYMDGVSKGLNKETMGYGMTFLHELDHTILGSSTTHSVNIPLL